MSERGLIFEELPDELDDSWRHGSLLGGMASCPDNREMAKAYRLCANTLVDRNTHEYEAYEVVYPILFLYRHALELYLKAILGEGRSMGHNIEKLASVFRENYKNSYGCDLPKHAIRLMNEIATYDRPGTTFRYTEGFSEGEYWVDFEKLKDQFDWLFDGLEKMPRSTR
jgi:hypothetical protein